jgi:hypothetical protein
LISFFVIAASYSGRLGDVGEAMLQEENKKKPK